MASVLGGEEGEKDLAAAITTWEQEGGGEWTERTLTRSTRALQVWQEVRQDVERLRLHQRGIGGTSTAADASLVPPQSASSSSFSHSAYSAYSAAVPASSPTLAWSPTPSQTLPHRSPRSASGSVGSVDSVGSAGSIGGAMGGSAAGNDSPNWLRHRGSMVAASGEGTPAASSSASPSFSSSSFPPGTPSTPSDAKLAQLRENHERTASLLEQLRKARQQLGANSSAAAAGSSAAVAAKEKGMSAVGGDGSRVSTRVARSGSVAVNVQGGREGY